MLQWSDVGWVHFFTKTPARTPDDIRRLKLFTSAGDPEAEKLYKEFGLKVVPLAVTDMLPSLQTNLIQAFDVPPLFALLDQSFGLAKNMMDVKWAPLAGATLVSRKTWDRIPEAQRAEMLRSGAARRLRARERIRKMGDDAVREMQKRGLNVVKLDAATRRNGEPRRKPPTRRLRGRVVPADLFDEVVRLHKEFRAKRPGRNEDPGPGTRAGLAVAVLALMSALPLVEMVWRKLAGARHPRLHSRGAAPDALGHLLGAALAAGSDRLLALSTAVFLPALARRVRLHHPRWARACAVCWRRPASTGAGRASGRRHGGLGHPGLGGAGDHAGGFRAHRRRG